MVETTGGSKQGDSDKPPQEHEGKSGDFGPSSRESKRVIGGFICAVGVGALFLGAMVSIGHWTNPLAQVSGSASDVWADRPWQACGVATIFVVAGALALMFQAGDHDLTKPIPALSPRYAIPIVLGLGVFFALAVACRPTEEAKTFALALPTLASEPQQAAAQTTTNSQRTVDTEQSLTAGKASRSRQTIDVQQSTSGPPPRPASSEPTLIFWRTTLPLTDSSSGYLPIMLGGLVISAFGIWFPRIDFTKSGSSIELTEKLIAPVLSLALVGFGAGAQIDAARTATNEKLTEQGLPPTISTSAQSPVYLANQGTLNQTMIENLSKAIQDLQNKPPAEVTVVAPTGQPVDLSAVHDLTTTLRSIDGALKGTISVNYPESVEKLGRLMTETDKIKAWMDTVPNKYEPIGGQDAKNLETHKAALCSDMAAEIKQLEVGQSTFGSISAKDIEQLDGKNLYYRLPYVRKRLTIDRDRTKALSNAYGAENNVLRKLNTDMGCK